MSKECQREKVENSTTPKTARQKRVATVNSDDNPSKCESGWLINHTQLKSPISTSCVNLSGTPDWEHLDEVIRAGIATISNKVKSPQPQMNQDTFAVLVLTFNLH